MKSNTKSNNMRLIVDVDGTLTHDDPSIPYCDRLPRMDIVERVNALFERGVYVVIYTARNMRTYQGNLGLINLNTLPTLASWLEKNGICYHEIYVGKPWCGPDGFYVRSNAIRPDLFLRLPMADLEAMCSIEPLMNGAEI